MANKSYLGISLFILMLFLLIQVYQRSDQSHLSFQNERRFMFAPHKDFGEPSFPDSESYSFDEDSKERKPPDKPAALKRPKKPARPKSLQRSRNSSYEVELLQRIALMDLPDDEYIQGHLRRQQERHALRDAFCSSTAPSFPDRDIRSFRNIWVDEKYKFVYCSIPKVACTSWKSVLLVLSGVANSTDQFEQRTINGRSGKWMKQLWQYSPDERSHILRTYTKFMFSRDPFSRVLSAFRNKLAPDSSFERAPRWQAKLGTKILRMFRESWKMGDPYDLKFSEFARFISTGHGFNKHWNLQFMQCMPCDIDYTILGHFETIQEDSDFILKVVGADGAVSFPSSNHSSPTNSSDQSIFTSYYNTLTVEELRELYWVYKRDFNLFGYPRPDRLKGLER